MPIGKSADIHDIRPGVRNQHGIEGPQGPGDGGDMEARVAKLEAHVEHIQSDISEIRSDIKELRSAIIWNKNN